jgi:hypothetical protein
VKPRDCARNAAAKAVEPDPRIMISQSFGMIEPRRATLAQTGTQAKTGNSLAGIEVISSLVLVIKFMQIGGN